MMDEKTMVSDTLTGINGELKMYAEYISQSEDPKLKQTLKHYPHLYYPSNPEFVYHFVAQMRKWKQETMK